MKKRNLSGAGCKNCHQFFKRKAAYMAAYNEHLEEDWLAMWNQRKIELDEELPCSVIASGG